MEFIVPLLNIMIRLQVAQLYYLQVFRTDIGQVCKHWTPHLLCGEVDR